MSRLAIFVSGVGSVARSVIQAARDGELNTSEVVLVSNHPELVAPMARSFSPRIPVIEFPGGDADDYRMLVYSQLRASMVVLTGWIKKVRGLEPATTINIHPAPLPDFGGKGMFGVAVHSAVLDAYRVGRLKATEVSIHFVTSRYDRGPVFLRCSVPIEPEDTPGSLRARVQAVERICLPYAVGAVLNGNVKWDGINPGSLHIADSKLPSFNIESI